MRGTSGAARSWGTSEIKNTRAGITPRQNFFVITAPELATANDQSSAKATEGQADLKSGADHGRFSGPGGRRDSFLLHLVKGNAKRQ